MKAFYDVNTNEGVESTKTLLNPHLENIFVELAEGDDSRPFHYANLYTEFFNLTGEHDQETGDPKPMFSDVQKAFQVIFDAIIAFLLFKGLDDVNEDYEIPEYKIDHYNEGLNTRVTFIYRGVCVAIDTERASQSLGVVIYDSEEDENPEFLEVVSSWNEVFEFIEEQTY